MKIFSANLGNKDKSSILAHPCFGVPPHSSSDGAGPVYDFANRITLPGTYSAPPSKVVGAFYASEWTLELSLSYGAASISETSLTANYIAPVNNMRDKVDQFRSSIIDYYNNSFETSGYYNYGLSYSIEIGSHFNLAYAWDSGLWSMPVLIQLFASKVHVPTGTIEEAGAFLVGAENYFGDALGGVSVSVDGVSGQLKDINEPSSTAFPSGSISLTPSAWLPI